MLPGAGASANEPPSPPTEANEKGQVIQPRQPMMTRRAAGLRATLAFTRKDLSARRARTERRKRRETKSTAHLNFWPKFYRKP